MKGKSTGGAKKRAIRKPLARRVLSRQAVEEYEFPKLSEAELKEFKRVSLAKRVRWKLKLSQSAFAKTYEIPLGTLRDWEQHRSEPDSTAKAYLRAIESVPQIAKHLKKTREHA